MNVTVYPEAEGWLFSERSPAHVCMWSFGRHQPPADIGDDLIFRRDGFPVGRSIVRGIYKPGELDCMQFDGSRKLTGWKLLWYQIDFQDLRELKLPKAFGTLTEAMSDVVRMIAENGGRHRIGGHIHRTNLAGLLRRGLIETSDGEATLTAEGWRAALREVNPQRQMDMEHDPKGFDGRAVCRICGCTDNSGCQVPGAFEGTCCWNEEDLCSRCDELLRSTGGGA